MPQAEGRIRPAEQFNASGQWELGCLYRDGRGVAQNAEQAAYWFCETALQGDAQRQCELGEMYREGRGIEQNNEEAVNWFWRAAKQGNSEAQEALRELGVEWKI